MDNLTEYQSDFSAMVASLKRYAEVAGAVALDGLKGIIAEGETHTFNITNYDIFSTYTVSSNQGTVSIAKDVITISTLPGVRVINPYLLKVTKNGVPRTIEMKIVSTGVSPVDILAPIAMETFDTNALTIRTSDFAVYPVGSQTHVSSDYQIASDPDFTNIVWSSMADTVNKTVILVTDLPYAEKFYIRARHRGSSADVTANLGDWTSVAFRTGKTKLTNFATSWDTSWDVGRVRQTSRQTAWATDVVKWNEDAQGYQTQQRQTSRLTTFDTVEAYVRQTNHYTDDYTEWDTTKQVYTSYTVSQMTGYWQAGGVRYSSYMSYGQEQHARYTGIPGIPGVPDTGSDWMTIWYENNGGSLVTVPVGTNPDVYVSYATAYQAGNWTTYTTRKSSGFKGQTYYDTAIATSQTHRTTSIQTERNTDAI
jgi:hypothetical protein